MKYNDKRSKVYNILVVQNPPTINKKGKLVPRFNIFILV